MRLWRVSDRSATDPVTTTIAAWARAVAPRPSNETLVARIPAALVSVGGTAP